MLRVILGAACAILLGGWASAQDGEPELVEAPDIEPGELIEDAASLIQSWPTPEPVDFVCPFKGDIDYEPGEISCGFITVPENRERVDSRMIRLHYVKLSATGEEADIRPDPVIYLTGGPGAGVGGYVARFQNHALIEQRDLYILEQRGIGASGDFCPYFGQSERSLVHADDVDQAQRNGAETMRNCFEAAQNAGVDLTAYNTVENARDVQALRQALGYESWNVWGISYGSHLGQMLTQVDPEGIDALIIDAIVPNDLTDLMRIGRWANLVLENVFSECGDNPHCDGLEARLDAALEARRGNPIVVETNDSELFPGGSMQVGAEALLFAPFMMAYEQSEHPAIPAVMDAFIGFYETGDESFFDLIAGGPPGGGGFAYSPGMSAAVRCNDGYTHESAAVIAEDLAENPRFAGLMFTVEGANYQASVCDEMGLSPRDRADYGFIETDIPTLVVNGGWDPVTPPAMAEYIAPGFSNGRLIIVPYAGHGPTRSMGDCAGPVMNAFFDNPDPAALDASCLEEGVGAPEFLAITPTRAPLMLASAALDDPANLVKPGLWAGVPLLILVLGFVLIPFGALARLVDGQPAAEIKADLTAPRWLGFLAAATGLGFAALTGAGLYASSEVSAIALIAGLHPVGALAPWLVLASGILGAITVVTLIQRRLSEGSVRFGSLTGLVFIGVSGMALLAFALAYDLSVF